MKVLLTGCTAQHCTPASHRRVANFSGLLTQALRDVGNDVFWQEPSVSWDANYLLATYDHVIVGLAPVTSLAANRVYGALSVISELIKTNKLTILVDAPEPLRLGAGFRAIQAHPENLLKSFYAYRKEYVLALKLEDKLLNVIDYLTKETWPTTVVPRLPWHTKDDLVGRLPYDASRVVPLNLDRLLFGRLPIPASRTRRQVWATENGPAQYTVWPKETIPRKGADGYDNAVASRMSGSSGTLLGSYRDGTWWNTRYLQSMLTTTPVFSDWRETKALGDPAWTILPGNMETTTEKERNDVAHDQFSAYLRHCPDTDEIGQWVNAILHPRSRFATPAA